MMVIKEEDIESANVEEHVEEAVVNINPNLNMASVAEASVWVAEASVAEIWEKVDVEDN